MIVISAKFSLAASAGTKQRCRGITFASVWTAWIADIPDICHFIPLVPGTSSPNRNLLKADRHWQITFEPPVRQTPPDTDTSDMLFSLRLLVVFAISVAAVPPSPHSIDTTIAGRQRDPPGGCKNQTIIEQKIFESGVVATHYQCNDLVERMDGLEKRDNQCVHYDRVCSSRGKLSPPGNAD
jgi:hypothetical protein